MVRTPRLERLFRVLRRNGTGTRGRRAAAANAAWLFAERAVRLLVSITIGVWVARYLAPARYGELALAMAIIALAAPLARLGLDSVVVNQILRMPARRQSVLASAFVLKLLAGVLGFALVAATARVVPSLRDVTGVIVIMGSSLIWSPLEVGQFGLEADLKGRQLVSARLAAGLVAAGLNVVWIFLGADVTAFAWTVAIEAALGGALVAVPRWREWTAALPGVRPKTLLPLIKESWPLAVAGLSVLVYMKIDVVMLNGMKGSQAVGIYAAATRLSELWYIVPTVVVSSLTPAVLRARARSRADYEDALGALIEGLTGVAVLAAALTTAVAGGVVFVLFGHDYAQAATILRVHVWAAVFVFSGVGQSIYMVSERLNALTLIKAVLGGALNVGLNLILIPPYAGLGAAYATLVSYAMAGVFGNALFVRTRPILKLQVMAFRLAHLRRAVENL